MLRGVWYSRLHEAGGDPRRSRPVAVSALGNRDPPARSRPQSAGTYCFRAHLHAPMPRRRTRSPRKTNAIVQSKRQPRRVASRVRDRDRAPEARAWRPRSTTRVESSIRRSFGSECARRCDRLRQVGNGGHADRFGDLRPVSNGTGCSGEPVATQTVALSDGKRLLPTTQTVAEGGLSYRVSYAGQATSYATSDGICENLSSTLPTPASAAGSRRLRLPARPTPPLYAGHACGADDRSLAISKVGTPASATVGKPASRGRKVVTKQRPERGRTGVTGRRLASGRD